jgi:hypothetical protein
MNNIIAIEELVEYDVLARKKKLNLPRLSIRTEKNICDYLLFTLGKRKK